METLPYLLISLVVISLAFATANYTAWRLFERPPAAVLWAAAFGLAAVQYTLNIVSGWALSTEVYWVSANLVAFLVVCLVWAGHCARLRVHARPRRLAIIVTGLTLVSVGATTVVEWTGLRTAIAPAFSFLVMTSVAVMLFRSRRSPRIVQRMAAVVHLAFGLSQGLAAAIALQLGTGMDPAIQQAYWSVNFILMPAFFVALGISGLMLLATDLAYRLERVALTDLLTGVPNRRGYQQDSERLLSWARRHGQPLTLVMCDIDHFKQVNDRYGHAVGDRSLREFTEALGRCLRSEDVVGRIGGEEFAISLAGMDSLAARVVTARIREELDTHPVEAGGARFKLTASFGIAELRPGDDFSKLLNRADQAVYRAKNAGRDTVEVDLPMMPVPRPTAA